MNRKLIILAVAGGVAVTIALVLLPATRDPSGPGARSSRDRAAPVEVTPIERGPIVLRRTFNGTLEARAEFVVAPKVGGRVEKLAVNISDPVERDQVVAELDNEEYVQAVAQARAELAVARANLAEAENALQVAERELERTTTLRQRGVASESQLDAVNANKLAKQSEVEVAEAQVVRAEAALQAARIRLGYTRITAGWSGGEDRRVVAERFVDEGETVTANTPLLRIVELDPISGVIHATERDYGRLQPGQNVALATDAFPGEEFTGRIERIAPVFKQATRQARVELVIDNPGQRLKPGMFIRASVVLDTEPDAVIVPEKALARRDDRDGIFLVAEDGRTVRWHEVTVGIRDGDRVQLMEENLSGRVVTLGQQMLEDGSTITIPEAPPLRENGPGRDQG